MRKVSTDPISRFIRGEEPKLRTVDAIREAFERAGIELTNDDRPSARLRKR
jgi:hypothetical protein